MPTTVFKLTAEERDALRGLGAIFNAQKKNEDQARRTNSAWAESKKAIGEMGKQAGGDLASMVTGLASVGTAVAALSKAYHLLSKDIEDASANAKKHMDQLLSAVAGANDMARLPEIRMQLMNMDLPGMSQQGRVGLYSSVKTASPNIKEGNRNEIMKSAAQARKAGYSEEQAIELAGQAAQIFELSKLDGQKRSERDAVNFAMHMNEQMGKYGSKFDKGGMAAISEFVKGGFGTAEDAAGHILAALQSGQGVGDVKTTLDKISGLKEKKAETVKTKDPTVQAKLDALDKSLDEMDVEQESLRRQRYDLDANPKLKVLEKKRREESIKAREEQLRRNESDKRREREQLEKSLEVETVVLSEADQQANALLKLPPKERLAALQKNPALASHVLGTDANSFAVTQAYNPNAIGAGAREAQAGDLLTKRQLELAEDPYARMHIQAEIDATEAENEEAKNERKQALRRTKLRNALVRTLHSRNSTEPQIATELAKFDAAVAVGDDPFAQLGGTAMGREAIREMEARDNREQLELAQKRQKQQSQPVRVELVVDSTRPARNPASNPDNGNESNAGGKGF